MSSNEALSAYIARKDRRLVPFAEHLQIEGRFYSVKGVRLPTAEHPQGQILLLALEGAVEQRFLADAEALGMRVLTVHTGGELRSTDDSTGAPRRIERRSGLTLVRGGPVS